MIGLTVTPGPLPELASASAVSPWPEWIAAAATAAAFVVAAIAFAFDVSRRQKAQARLVYAEIRFSRDLAPGEKFPLLDHGGGNGGMMPFADPDGSSWGVSMDAMTLIHVALVNQSDELVGPAYLRFEGPWGGHRADTIGLVPYARPHDESMIEVYLLNESFPASRSYVVDALFRDSSGRWWKRHFFDAIERIHADPANGPETPEDLARRARNALALGLVDRVPEPKRHRVPAKVRVFRAWRRLRGRPAIP